MAGWNWRAAFCGRKPDLIPCPIPQPLPVEGLYTLTDRMTMLGLGIAGTCLECGWFQVHSTEFSAAQGVSGHIRREHSL